MKVSKWKWLLAGAQYYEQTNTSLSENFYRTACLAAEAEAGINSAASCEVLQRFGAFLKKQGREFEYLQCQKKVRDIGKLDESLSVDFNPRLSSMDRRSFKLNCSESQRMH